MRQSLKKLGLAIVMSISTALAIGSPVGAAAPKFRLPTADDFGREPAIDDVQLSPDGKHIAALISPDGKTAYVAVWRTDKMDQEPKKFGCGVAKAQQCVGVSFIKDDRLSVAVRQQYTLPPEQRVAAANIHIVRRFITDLDGGNQLAIDGSDGSSGDFQRAFVVDSLPREPRKVLIYLASKRSPGTAGQGEAAGNYYKLDIYSGRREKVFTGSDKFFSEQRDLDGEFRARQSLGYEGGNAYIAQWIREGNSWVEHFRWYAKDREATEVVGFTNDPNIIYVRANNGADNTAIYEYDIAARKLGEKIFAIKSFDAVAISISRRPEDYGRLTGFIYAAETYHRFWIDEKLGTLSKGVKQALGIKTTTTSWTDIATGEKIRVPIPDGVDAELVDVSTDYRYAIVRKEGPRQPAEFYLLVDGKKLYLLGKARPWFDTTSLGDMRLIQYQARDGLMVPGILTTPRPEIYGAGPYPTIIVPHGGPWARDNVDWDATGWTQYFAARGYAVLQPQYRGSEGWGQKLWRAGDREWGQKMQDDNDDGVKWMIAQGIADPQRVAMHGYSYGGYAAMAAAVRPNGLYQCAIAGAGPSSMTYMQTRTSYNSYQEEYQGQTIAGLSPVDHADEVSIPVFVYHGNRDNNVPIRQSEQFVKALESRGKSVKYLELDGMGHSLGTWEPGQTAQMLSAVDDYLRNDCGPGGL